MVTMGERGPITQVGLGGLPAGAPIPHLPQIFSLPRWQNMHLMHDVKYACSEGGVMEAVFLVVELGLVIALIVLGIVWLWSR